MTLAVYKVLFLSVCGFIYVNAMNDHKVVRTKSESFNRPTGELPFKRSPSSGSIPLDRLRIVSRKPSPSDQGPLTERELLNEFKKKKSRYKKLDQEQ